MLVRFERWKKGKASDRIPTSLAQHGSSVWGMVKEAGSNEDLSYLVILTAGTVARMLI